MSFTFEWPRFSDQFHTDAIHMLNNALNKGKKPPVIADKIEVVELEMGTQPPALEIRDIGDLTMDQFRGIFRFTYAGDAHIVLKTKVQANPLNHKQPDIHVMTGSRGMLAAKEPLVVPMLLRLSHFKLNSYVVLVVSKQKGITLVFKTDPLQNVDINSTFDSIAVIQKFIQREIEGQLRQMFREDLPGIIHLLSQQWVKAKVEAPYLTKHPSLSRQRPFDTVSAPDLPLGSPSISSVGLRPHILSQQSLSTMSYGRAGSVSGMSMESSSKKSVPTSSSSHTTAPNVPEPTNSFPELDNFDPTYGLRPEGLPAKSVFSSFGQLFTANRGLADLAEEPSELEDIDEDGNFFWKDTVPVGQGKRPPGRRFSESSSASLDVFHSGSLPTSHVPEPDQEIVLRPSLNNTIHKLSTLSHSNHTLSPYTRSLEHFTVRSVPPRGQSSGLPSTSEKPTVKARRKRTYRIGGKNADKPPQATPTTAPSSPLPPSEFDQSDIDRYFRSRDDFSIEPHDHHHVRKRTPY